MSRTSSFRPVIKRAFSSLNVRLKDIVFFFSFRMLHLMRLPSVRPANAPFSAMLPKAPFSAFYAARHSCQPWKSFLVRGLLLVRHNPLFPPWLSPRVREKGLRIPFRAQTVYSPQVNQT